MKNPLLSLFKCMSCHQSLCELNTLSSLCSSCALSLISSPPLCAQCGGVDCTQSCLRPWRRSEFLDSYSARYLMIAQGYQVLKSWKINRGLIFDQIVLKADERLEQEWREFQADAIVPMPQKYSRAWDLGGNRAEIIAQWVSLQLHLPLLSSALGVQKQQRQGTLNLNQRVENRLKFFVSLDSASALEKYKRVILVDDFKTTGRTLEKAAQSLKLHGVTHVHAFTLGVRPQHVHTQSSAHLKDRKSRSISIRH